ncbi:hypothetical protein BB561_004032 [Smittium simulii]|uniref:Anaphase-promoting complex subunit 11 n=1 Tax=Smittium simulii TaxID=133385 RepID=A0A2T9YIE4_9FUNG|nr:hypothetical protein BB561_004032 [Smittium simulii]
MKITLKQYNGVATWRWNTETEDICGICRLEFDACCPQCLFPGETCPIVEGTCGHIFHKHCIEKWSNSDKNNKSCPMDRLPWTLVKKP